MDQNFKFVGSVSKRKTIALFLLGLPALFCACIVNAEIFKGASAFGLQPVNG